MFTANSLCTPLQNRQEFTPQFSPSLPRGRNKDASSRKYIQKGIEAAPKPRRGVDIGAAAGAAGARFLLTRSFSAPFLILWHIRGNRSNRRHLHGNHENSTSPLPTHHSLPSAHHQSTTGPPTTHHHSPHSTPHTPPVTHISKHHSTTSPPRF